MKNNFFTQNKKWLFALAIVNIVLSILYFWSLGGARTNIKIIKTGNVFISEIDGYKSAEATFADTTTGSIGLGLFDSSFVEGIPDHQQVDWITITDNRSGAALFKEEFEGDLSKWQPNNGWEIVNGKARSSAVATELISTAQFGSNYSIEVEVSSLRRMFIFLDVNENGDKIIYSAVPWRDQASGFYQIKDGNRVEAIS